MSEKQPKKRGRKPKGGKIVKNENKDMTEPIEQKNVMFIKSFE